MTVQMHRPTIESVRTEHLPEQVKAVTTVNVDRLGDLLAVIDSLPDTPTTDAMSDRVAEVQRSLMSLNHYAGGDR